MRANETMINRLLLELNRFGKYTVMMIKGHNEENNYIYTKHILNKDGKEHYCAFSKREFCVYLMDYLTACQRRPKKNV